MLWLLVSAVQLMQWSQDLKGVTVSTKFSSASVTMGIFVPNTCSVLFMLLLIFHSVIVKGK